MCRHCSEYRRRGNRYCPSCGNRISRTDSGSDLTSVVVGGVVGAAADSALLGGLAGAVVGGSLVGGLIGGIAGDFFND